MTDRELLELAAKAVGYEWEYEDTGALFVFVPQAHEWNPLTDDGDALRLAVKLKLDVLTDCLDGVCISSAQLEEQCEPDLGDPYEATRRAIVRAAAEIGKGMK
jgi:hypothetical protein